MGNITDTSLATLENVAQHFRRDLMVEIEESVLDMSPFSVDVTAEFPTADTFIYGEVGDVELTDMDEHNGVPSTPFEISTGSFSIDKFRGIGHEFTQKQLEDGDYTEPKLRRLRGRMLRAGQKDYLASFLNLHSQQTVADLNNFNGQPHRFVGSGGSAAGARSLTIDDIRQVKLSFMKADRGGPIIGLVDPVDIDASLQAQITTDQIDRDPQWMGKIRQGLMGFGDYAGTIMGVDLYTTNMLPTLSAGETVDSLAVNAGARVNTFFTPGEDSSPYMHAWRRPWRVIEDYVANTDRERRKVSMSGRWGAKLYRPSGLVTVLCDS